ncbi:MAG: hypothetical protein UX04_C0002G0174 [Microgenomates group bacterium GW2011_GWF2_45_18]|nr:MAG: hypothetical protein UW18_C0009G0003 [Microgenomates group bacterium GW2011_GWF1_44_10]KKU02031.1 MAG: hypothetical protein UX04_C0002G0174 [Microgenomates group bacterium GW2011_GWF2_45_18]OGJ40621.1 MAG: hypothetical protein A2378_01140 [Candidatus Pacebacteria bacterium RIFOXYB1_FULL_44_10]
MCQSYQSPKLSNTANGIVIRLRIVVRVPIVLVRVPRILRGIAVRGTRPVIVSRKHSSLYIPTSV